MEGRGKKDARKPEEGCKEGEKVEEKQKRGVRKAQERRGKRPAENRRRNESLARFILETDDPSGRTWATKR